MADPKPSPENPAPKGIGGFHIPRTQAAALAWAENVLLFLLFFSCSTPLRITFDSFSIGITEIFGLVYILWRLAVGGIREDRMERKVRWLIRGLFVLAGWAFAVWILSANWEIRRTITTDWLLAAAVFLCLLRSPVRDWKRIALLMILAALPDAVLGVAQHALGIGLAPKDFSGWETDASSHPVIGLFQHSNDLATFLYWPLLLSIGLALDSRGGKRPAYAGLSLLFALVVYWSISRSILVTLAALGVGLALVLLIPRRKTFLWILAAGLLLAALGLAWILLTQPYENLNLLLSGRLTLWSRALQFITRDLLLLPFGFLISAPYNVRIFWLPHNIFLLFWIEYGWPGILLLAAGALSLLRQGWTRFEALRRERAAAVVWLGFAGIFAVNGLVSLYLHETHFILSFLGVAVLWTHQLREIDSRSPEATASSA